MKRAASIRPGPSVVQVSSSRLLRDSIEAQQIRARSAASNGLHFCGAYWGYGFHEDGVNSAMAVARHFGIGLEACTAASTKEPSRHSPRAGNSPVPDDLFMVYLDLDELPSLVGNGRLIGDSRWSPRSFLRRDHLFDSSVELQTELRQMIRDQAGCQSTGPIRLLTQLRHFGYYFSPLNLFFVYDPAGRRVDFVVAEVSNTPWRERHCYLLWSGNRTASLGALEFAHPKQFHVSPFMSMDHEYRWRLTQPGAKLDVQLANFRDDDPLFSASLKLMRRELNSRELRRSSLRYPWMTVQISTAIYYQALKLWWKKCPFYSHPKKLAGSPTRHTTKQTAAEAEIPRISS